MSSTALPSNSHRRFRVHLTNIVGTGAVQLVASLLPALERAQGFELAQIDLPDRGELAGYRRVTNGLAPVRHQRLLPNALSRMLECLFPGRAFEGPTPLLVLGDLPIRCNVRQVVFVQTPHLAGADRSGSRIDGLKFRIARAVFRANLRHADAFIVQTETMKAALMGTYPQIKDKICVIAQPVPAWLLASGLHRTGRRGPRGDALTLVYPAALYPHKNHRLLARTTEVAGAWPIKSLMLTIPPTANPNPRIDWIHCVGLLAPMSIIAAYNNADALLFLSMSESYGFPLLEAMWVGLPIVCPDLPYARSLCGDQAIYFEADNIESLCKALEQLSTRLDNGWWPDWSTRLEAIPRDWNAVAHAMLAVVFGPAKTSLSR